MAANRYWAQVPTIGTLGSVTRSEFSSQFEVASDWMEGGNFTAATLRGVELFGGDGDLAESIIDRWTVHPYESSLRWIVTELIERNVQHELSKILSRSAAFTANIAASSDDPEAIYRKMDLSHQRMTVSSRHARDDRYLKTVKAIASLSQATLNTESVTLYRGVYGKQAKYIYERSKRAAFVPIGIDQTTSFTSDYGVAMDFAEGASMTDRTTKFGITLTLEVPRYAIIATPIAFGILTDEAEFIVASHGSMMVSSELIRVVH